MGNKQPVIFHFLCNFIGLQECCFYKYNINTLKEEIIDLRSDTLTLPTEAMQSAMQQARLGDDVYREDPTVQQLEQKAADMFGMEAAIFCASGTMTNQLAIKAHTHPGDEVICEKNSHVYMYEAGGIAANSLSSVKLLTGDLGRISADQVQSAINNPNDIHLPVSRLVSLENTANRGGGAYYNFKDIQKIKKVCQDNHLALHLDGARLFNALTETQQTPADYGEVFDSISICLSKGLGCPVGSLLLGKTAFIEKTRRLRKQMGGGWRQAGVLAAAGIYALDHHILRLKEDHRHALEIAQIVEQQSFCKELYPVSTNIIIMKTAGISALKLVDAMKQINIYGSVFGEDLVRFVTHLNIEDQHVDLFEARLKRIAL